MLTSPIEKYKKAVENWDVDEDTKREVLSVCTSFHQLFVCTCHVSKMQSRIDSMKLEGYDVLEIVHTLDNVLDYGESVTIIFQKRK